MKFFQIRYLAIILAAMFFVLGTTSEVVAETEDKELALELNFLMAHKPDNPDNVKLIKDFAARVKERTNGAIVINPINVEGEQPHRAAIRAIYSDIASFAQISAKHFRPGGFSEEIDVVDMPMLFRDHDHATKVLDGPIGKDLMQSVYDGSDGRVKPLAFTYSGGFRNYFSTKELSSLKDFDNDTFRIRYLGGRMSLDMANALGLHFHPVAPNTKQWVRDHLRHQVDLDESEVIRLVTYQNNFPSLFKNIKTVFETNHSLYLTLIVVNGDLFDNHLTDEQKAIVQEEADKLAQQERELSIQQGIDGKADFQKRGIVFVEMSDEDSKILNDAAAKVYKKYDKHLGKWIKAIKAVE